MDGTSFATIMAPQSLALLVSRLGLVSCGSHDDSLGPRCCAFTRSSRLSVVPPGRSYAPGGVLPSPDLLAHPECVIVRRSLAGLRQSSRTSVSDQPASPRLPEVEEYLTAHEAYENTSNSTAPSHDVVEDKLDLRTLRIAESTRSTSPLSIGRTSGARPSTDRSNFF